MHCVLVCLFFVCVHVALICHLTSKKVRYVTLLFCTETSWENEYLGGKLCAKYMLEEDAY